MESRNTGLPCSLRGKVGLIKLLPYGLLSRVLIGEKEKGKGRCIMLVKSAIKLITQLVYKPEWEFQVEDSTKRYENSVMLTIHYPARETDREDAESGYSRVNKPHASFILMVGNVDAVELYRKVANAILEIEQHEMREFLRVEPTYWAPFHPHQEDGMKRWGTFHDDLKFGLA